ncbi:MAG: phosphoglycerate kinase [Epsilonproteobacteria bacterium]|nr:phosphoglycerate kinase [Campylobacterota bacterium]
MALRTIRQLDVANKRVLLRADLNVPRREGKILHDYRIKMLVPTINYLLEQNSKIILATHIGRPKPQQEHDFVTHPLSTRMLVSWFKEHGFAIEYESNLEQAQHLSHEKPQTILLLENMRFFEGEQKPSSSFAQQLCNLADIYINDAFGAAHRTDTSLTLVPKLFDKKSKGIGLLIEREMSELERLQHTPDQPFILVLGGCKIGKKIPIIDHFLSQKAHRAEHVLLGGAIALVFLKVQGLFQTTLEIEPASLAWAETLLKKATHKQINLHLPLDLVWHGHDSTQLQTTSVQELGKSTISVVDIGPQTIELFTEKIKNAATIFANGPMGIYENKTSQKGTRDVLTAIADAEAFAIIGGGDIVAAAHTFGVADRINFCSTGGGATLAYLAAQDPHQQLSGLMHL